MNSSVKWSFSSYVSFCIIAYVLLHSWITSVWDRLLFFRALDLFRYVITFLFTVLWSCLCHSCHISYSFPITVVSSNEVSSQGMVPVISKYNNLEQSCKILLFSVLHTCLILLAIFLHVFIKYYFWVFLTPKTCFLLSHLNVKGICDFLMLFVELETYWLVILFFCSVFILFKILQRFHYYSYFCNVY
jgi:hypothetical protein